MLQSFSIYVVKDKFITKLSLKKIEMKNFSLLLIFFKFILSKTFDWTRNLCRTLN